MLTSLQKLYAEDKMFIIFSPSATQVNLEEMNESIGPTRVSNNAEVAWHTEESNSKKII